MSLLDRVRAEAWRRGRQQACAQWDAEREERRQELFGLLVVVREALDLLGTDEDARRSKRWVLAYIDTMEDPR